jgi:Lysozyme like domain/Ricin-type beta-trefoil lectin domain
MLRGVRTEEGASMRAVTVSPVARLVAAVVVSLLLAGGAAVTRASDTPAPPARQLRLASPAPHGAAGPLSAARAASAAQACASYAAAAGWANNGYYGGNLVTAVAVCVAESGGNPAIYYCEATGTDGIYPPVRCPGGSYDRGLWQLNSKDSVTDACAFRPACNARAAYAISAAGASFSPWAVYGSGDYAQYLAAAQAAVSALGGGALSSAVFGMCAARSAPVPGAAVVAGDCGHAAAAQQWTVTGGTLRSGTLCLTAGSGDAPAVTTAPCSGDAGQTWTAEGPGELRNARTGRCLRDPNASRAAGTALGLAPCTGTRGRTWWLP